MSDEKIPVLLDTDIGSDIDDALALAYLLNQPRCELLGVTTVTGEPEVRAQLVDAIGQTFGRTDVPIHSGAADPLLVPQEQGEVPQNKALTNWPHRDDFELNTAVDFLRETIHSRPGEITLLSIGPLTNIGLLFAVDPEIPKLLKRHVMMGGVYFGELPRYGRAEWNTRGDPHATAIVFARGVSDMRCVGLDVTCRCKLSADECHRRLNEGPLKIVGEMAEVWFEGRSDIIFHDPLAAACIFEPELVSFQAGLVEVDLQGDQPKGLTNFDAQAECKPHQVAVEVKPEAFFEHYFKVIERAYRG